MANIPKYCDTPEKVEEWKAKWAALRKAYKQTPQAKAYEKARRETPEYKAYIKAYQKAYEQTPESKAAVKARQQTPKAKAVAKSYRETPEARAAQKSRSGAYYQTFRKEQSTADAFRMMQAASELAKALTNLSEPTPQNK